MRGHRETILGTWLTGTQNFSAQEESAWLNVLKKYWLRNKGSGVLVENDSRHQSWECSPGCEVGLKLAASG
jgi:hypothetical protein